MTVLTAIATLGGLAFLLASLLLAASRRFHTDEDPRIDRINNLLPQNNCGACGYAGCRAFAEALVTGDAQPAACTVSTAAESATIATTLGVDVGERQQLVARLACAGGTHVARQRAHYRGPPTCIAASEVAGGGKDCLWGCLGHGDCVAACEFDALHMNAHGLPAVIAERCVACGDCVEICPKDLFSLQPVDDHLWVTCRNEELGEHILAACAVGCTGCGRCARDAPGGSITMAANLPHIDQTRIRQYPEDTARQSIDSCPTGAIVWVDATGYETRGAAAAPIIRRSARGTAPT